MNVLTFLRWHTQLTMVVVCAALTGCGQFGNQEGPGHRSQRLALTPQEELLLGTKAYREFLYKHQDKIVSDGQEPERVRRVGGRIVQAAMIRPLQREINLHFNPAFYQWEYTVFRAPQINAFCMPGGKIGVFTGLLKVAANDDQLATVLSHEIAHALAHHASERLARGQMLAPAGRYASGGDVDPQHRNKVVDILAGLGGLAHDRAQESEADHIGVFLMTFSGYDPNQAVIFWQRMHEATADQGRPPEILSDHPSDTRRIQQMQQWVPKAIAAKKAYDAGRVAPESGG
jgi:metalloendopeptidase OMA1, mitochondrial